MEVRSKRFACLFFLVASISCALPAQTNSTMSNTVNNDGHRLTLTAKDRVAEQTLPGSLASPEKYKFVEVSVVSVVNPGQHSVSFDVQHVSSNGETTFLGTFSLFPADNPGTFIVPTKRKLAAGGRLVLSLKLPPEVSDDDSLVIIAKEMRLRED